MKLLIVDDDQAVLEVAKYCLGERYEMRLASSGPEALLVLASNKIDVMVCDQRMPGMSGAELCRQAAEVSPDTSQIIITAYSDFQELRTAVSGGKLVACLQKPLREAELISVLEKLRKHPSTPAMTKVSIRPRLAQHAPPDELRKAEVVAEAEVEEAREELRASRRAVSGSFRF